MIYNCIAGSMNDASVFAHSDLGLALERNEFEFPMMRALPQSNLLSPYFIIGDGIFPLKTYLMKPYVDNINLTVPNQVFNYRLSHARRIVECAFGQLCKKWRVNECKLCWGLQTVDKIIMSTVLLHNFLITCEVSEDDREAAVRVLADREENN